MSLIDEIPFDELKASLIVLKGCISNCKFIINELYPLCEPTKRIIWIIAPKIGTEFRIKGWHKYNPNYKKPTNRGRPPLPNKKVKNMNTLRTTISFYIKSKDPKQPKKHVYKIKLYITGTLNIPGVLHIPGQEDIKGTGIDKDPYLMDCINILREYVLKRLDILRQNSELPLIELPHDIIIGHKHPTINCKSMLKSKKEFNRNAIYEYINERISSYSKTDIAQLKKFISCIIFDDEISYEILNDYSEVDIRYDKKYLDSLLKEINMDIIYMLEDTPTLFLNTYKNELVDYYHLYISYKLIVHESNYIYSVNPLTSSHRGVKLTLNVKTTFDKYKIPNYKKNEKHNRRKLHIYKRGNYNSHPKTFKEARWIHAFMNKLIYENEDVFILKEDVVFELI